jgi:uncharacterized protein with PIN domain
MADIPKFIVDRNVGKLTGWLRLMGYDTRFFDGDDDSELVAMARAEGRVILSRDTRIMERRLITSGQIKAVLIDSDQPERQIHQVIDTLGLDSRLRPFSLCLECNQPLVERGKDEVKDLVPPYVFKTQDYFMQCPNCQRLYWRGTHWQAMTQKLESLRGS